MASRARSVHRSGTCPRRHSSENPADVEDVSSRGSSPASGTTRRMATATPNSLYTEAQAQLRR